MDQPAPPDARLEAGGTADDPAREALLEEAEAALRRSAPDLPAAAAVLLRRLFADVPGPELAGIPSEVVAEAAASLFAFARERPPGQAKLRVLPPGPGRGPHAVVEIVTDDMPFLVDSALAALARQGPRGAAAPAPDRGGAARRRRAAAGDRRAGGERRPPPREHDAHHGRRGAGRHAAGPGHRRLAGAGTPRWRAPWPMCAWPSATTPPWSAAAVRRGGDRRRAARGRAGGGRRVPALAGGREFRPARPSPPRCCRRGRRVGVAAGGESRRAARPGAAGLRRAARPRCALACRARAPWSRRCRCRVAKANMREHRAPAAARRRGGDAHPRRRRARRRACGSSSACSPRRPTTATRAPSRCCARRCDASWPCAGVDPDAHDGRALRNILDTWPRDELFQAPEAAILAGALRRARPADPAARRRCPCAATPSGASSPPSPGCRATPSTRGCASASASCWRRPIGGRLSRLLHRARRRAAGAHPLHHRHRPGAPRARWTRRCWKRRSRRPRAASASGWARRWRVERGEADGGGAARPLARRLPARLPRERDRRAGRGRPRAGRARAGRRPARRRPVAPGGRGRRALALRLANPGGPLPLADALPLFESLDLRAIEEVPYRLSPDGGTRGGAARLRAAARRGAERAGRAVRRDRRALPGAAGGARARCWRARRRRTASTGWCCAPACTWRECWLLRAMFRWLKQVGFAFAQDSVEAALAAHPRRRASCSTSSTRRFDPDFAGDRAAREAALAADWNALLDEVANPDEDRILARLRALLGRGAADQLPPGQALPGLQDRQRRGGRHAGAAALARDLRAFAAHGGRASARRPGGARRHPLVATGARTSAPRSSG